MGIFLVYIFKVTICLSVFYLFYRLLLSRETFHRFNRIALIGVLLISILLPFCEIKVTEHTEVQQTVLTLEQLLLLADMVGDTPVVQVEESKTVWVHVVLLVYIAGICFFAGRHFYSLFRLCVLLRSGKREKTDGNITLVIHNKEELAPFSWMRYIVISHKDLEENGREILIHELAHIHKCHSIDLFIADICIFFQWFNPAAWLLKQELQNIHEYQADETVIKEGVNAKEYQLLLIKKAVGTRLYSMANSFNHSKLKKRITMMLKEKSSPWARLKYLYVLPLAAIAVSAFARPEISKELKEISEVKVNDLTAIVATNIAENQVAVQPVHITEETTAYVEVESPRSEQENFTTTDSAKTSEPLKGNRIEIDGMDLLKGKIVKVEIDGMDITVKARQSNPQSVTTIKVEDDNKKPLIVVDGKEMENTALSQISPDLIKSMTVLKDKAAVDLYGVKAENGVIMITLLTDEEREEKAKKPKKSILTVAQEKLPSEALILLDGEVFAKGDVINSENISHIRIYKDGSTEEGAPLFEKYGEKANAGIISITSKKPGDTQATILQVVGERNVPKTINVNGQVKDSNGKPIVGAAVVVAGTTVGTITDLDGKFALQARDMDYVTVIFIGMKKAVAQVAPELIITLEDE